MHVASIALTFVGGGLFAGNFLLPLFFQSLRGYSPLDAALLLIPQGVGTFLIRFVVGKLVGKFGSRLVAVVGALVMAAATVPFALASADTSLWLLGIFLFIRRLGNGVLLIPIMAVAYTDIGNDQMPHASAITRIVQQLGGAFSTALVAVILTAAATQTHPAAGFDAAFWWTTVITLAAAVAALLLPAQNKGKSHVTDAPKRGPERGQGELVR